MCHSKVLQEFIYYFKLHKTMGNNKKIKPITLEIDKDVWEEFKESIPRAIRLNDVVVVLIKQHLIKKEKVWLK